MPIARLSRTQRTTLRTALGDEDLANTIIEQLDAVQDGTVSGLNNAQPTYVAGADYIETIDGVQVVHLTVNAVRAFFETTMSLEPKHVNALREEGVTHPIDLAMFDSKDFESVIHSMKGKRCAPPGIAQIRLKQACDFFQYIAGTERTMKDAYLDYDSIKSHAIQFKAIMDQKDSKDGPKGLPKLSISTDVLAWIDKVDKCLRKLSGQDGSPLAYLIRETAAVPTTVVDLLPGKCYSVTYKSLVEELVARKSFTSSCVEADRVMLYDHLDKALSHGPYESTLQAFEDSKDGQAVMGINVL